MKINMNGVLIILIRPSTNEVIMSRINRESGARARARVTRRTRTYCRVFRVKIVNVLLRPILIRINCLAQSAYVRSRDRKISNDVKDEIRVIGLVVLVGAGSGAVRAAIRTEDLFERGTWAVLTM